MDDSNADVHDPDGPVVVDLGIPLGVVRGALGAARWISRPGAFRTCALLVTHDAERARHAADRGIPVLIATDERTLAQQLRAFDDGALISTREAEALAWVEAIRSEEERNQRERARLADERVEALQARVDELEAYAGSLSAHVAAIEASRSWAVARRLTGGKERLLRLVAPWRRRG